MIFVFGEYLTCHVQACTSVMWLDQHGGSVGYPLFVVVDLIPGQVILNTSKLVPAAVLFGIQH